MKLLVIILLLSMFNGPINDSNNVKHPYSIQLLATVHEKSEGFITLHIEEVINYGSKIYVIPNEGDKLTARLPELRPPENHTTIIVELREKISIGENPSSYIVVDYRTVK